MVLWEWFHKKMIALVDHEWFNDVKDWLCVISQQAWCGDVMINGQMGFIDQVNSFHQGGEECLVKM